MKRGEFLQNLGLSCPALMAFYCMGASLTACSGTNGEPAPATPPDTGTCLTGNTQSVKGRIDFTLDLTCNDYKTLKTEGGFVQLNEVVVANAKGGKFVAVGRICTHAAGSLKYRLAENDFQCDTHFSEFTIEGKVKPNWQAKTDVKQYKTTLSTDGNKLQVTE